jgi:nitrite reductase/ring-hydroxylating ferredoxin subunit
MSAMLLARVDDIPDGGGIVVHIAREDSNRSVILTRRGGKVAAFENRCPHAGYPLQHADGDVRVQQGRYLLCGAHGASYVLETGACAGGPCNGKALTRFAIAVREGAIYAA